MAMMQWTGKLLRNWEMGLGSRFIISESICFYQNLVEISSQGIFSNFRKTTVVSREVLGKPYEKVYWSFRKTEEFMG